MSTSEKLAEYRESKRRWQSKLTEKETFLTITTFMDNIENMLIVIRDQMMLLDPDSPNFKQEFDLIVAQAEALVKIMGLRDEVRNR